MRRRRRGGLEAEVLEMPLGAERPLTVAEVRDGLDDDLAYTTVMTALSRMYEKGEVEREPRARAYAYRAVIDRPGIAAARMRRALEEDGDRHSMLMRFVDSLCAADEQALRGLLRTDPDADPDAEQDGPA